MADDSDNPSEQSLESKLLASGLDGGAQEALAKAYAVEAMFNSLAGRVGDLEDDIAEPDGAGSDGYAGTWSGWLWYLGAATQVLDPATESPTGNYLKVKLADGTTSMVNELASPSDTDEYNYYYVASGDSEDGYVLFPGRVVGDIRIDYVPYIPEDES